MNSKIANKIILSHTRLLWIVALFLAWNVGAVEVPAELQQQAEQGAPAKQTELGLFYLKEKNNPVLGAHWLNLAYRQGDGRAALYLGSLYEQGAGVERSLKRAFECYELAALKQNSLHAQYRLALLLNSGIPPEKNGQVFRSGVDPDPVRSKELMAKLEKAGFLPAVLDLANKKLDDPALTPKQAQELFQSLERLYRSDSTGKVGMLVAECLQRGIGTPFDLERRFEVLKLIAPRNPEAETLLGLSYETAAGCPPDSESGFKHIKNAAERGSALAKMRLGDHYLSGLHISGDPQKALLLYQESLSAGIPGAWAKIGFCLLNGLGTPVDKRRALEYFLQGAGRGDREARYYTMMCFANGWGTPIDLESAEFWKKSLSVEMTEPPSFNPSNSLPVGTLL